MAFNVIFSAGFDETYVCVYSFVFPCVFFEIAFWISFSFVLFSYVLLLF